MINPYISDSFDKMVEKNGSPAPNCRSLETVEKMFKDT